jgi:hypothetical protein
MVLAISALGRQQLESFINRAHEYVDRAKARHDVGHLGPLENVGQDLQVAEVGGADLEAPRGDVVVAQDIHTDLALARFQPGVELAAWNLEGRGHFFGHVLTIEGRGWATFGFCQLAGLEVFGEPPWDHLAVLAQDPGHTRGPQNRV